VSTPVEITQFVRAGRDYRIIDTDMTELERPPMSSMR